MVVRVSTGLACGFKKFVDKPSSTTSTEFAKNDIKDNYTSVIFNKAAQLQSQTLNYYGLNNPVDISNNIYWDANEKIDASSQSLYVNNPPNKDVSNFIGKLLELTPKDFSSESPYFNLLPWLDIGSFNEFNVVYRFDNKPIPPIDYRYLPTLDFQLDESELMSFKGDFIKPIDYDKFKTRMSPLVSTNNFPWGKADIADIYSDIKWGYNANQFNVGGVINNQYLIDNDALVGAVPDLPTTQRVITFVNSINIYALPARTPIKFSDFQLSYDLDSVAWAFSMSVPDKTTVNLVKPTQASIIELEVDINGILFLVFVSKTSTRRSVDESGKVTQRINCTGYSVHKLLSQPYSPKKSYTYAGSNTASTIINSELSGSGFTAVYSTVNWTIPTNVVSYIDKSPLGAILEITNAIGAVIIPTSASKEITIKPRYPVSPWNWGAEVPDYSLNESNFFSIDSEWIPQESPDSIYVFGEDDNGVAVKCTKVGTGGTKTLPSITNKYMTDTTPAAERGRIEVAKNGFIESIPISTYIDPAQGLITPPALVEVTETDGITKWRALVVSTSITIKRNGRPVIQTLQLERHYDGV